AKENLGLAARSTRNFHLVAAESQRRQYGPRQIEKQRKAHQQKKRRERLVERRTGVRDGFAPLDVLGNPEEPDGGDRDHGDAEKDKSEAGFVRELLAVKRHRARRRLRR